MKVRNHQIVALADAGVLRLTAATIPCESAYNVIKLRRAMSTAFSAILESEQKFAAECGLEIKEDGSLKGKEKDKDRFGKFREQLLKDEADLGDIKPIPYADWHTLQGENKSLVNVDIEDMLEGVLWTL